MTISTKKGYILKIYGAEGQLFSEHRGFNKMKLMKNVSALNKDLGFKLDQVPNQYRARDHGGGWELKRVPFMVNKKR